VKRISAGSQVAGVPRTAGVLLVLSVTRGFMTTIGGFISDETGQDLVEYSLLIAFIALAGAAMFIGMSGSVNTIWSAANNKLAAANGS